MYLEAVETAEDTQNEKLIGLGAAGVGGMRGGVQPERLLVEWRETESVQMSINKRKTDKLGLL